AREGSLSEYEVQSVHIQLGFLGIPSQMLTQLIGNKEFAVAVSAEDIPWIKEFRKALPSVKLVLVINENEQARFEQDLKKDDPDVKLWAQSKGNLFETKTDQNGHTARVINLAFFEAGIASGLNISQASPHQVKALLDNIAVGFRGGVTFNADGIGPNSLLSQVEKVILDSLFQGMRVQVSLNDFVELAKKLAIQA
ncbi:MAG: hypothetical protein LHV69_08665, partial [Elusimicrobia bacterium]|nr:hypothetical protein [Candidatus Obscuribacterium magneticum]